MKPRIHVALMACCVGLILVSVLYAVQIHRQSKAYEYAYAEVHQRLLMADQNLHGITVLPSDDRYAIGTASAHLQIAYGMIRNMYKISQRTWSPLPVGSVSAISYLEFQIGEAQRAIQTFSGLSEPNIDEQDKFLFDYEKSRLHFLVEAGEASKLPTGEFDLGKLHTHHWNSMR